MKIIKPTFEILEPYGYTLGDIWKQIERASRVCYKSEDKITDNSAPDFVNRMIKSKHYAMLEHGTVYLTFTLYHDRGGEEYERLCQMYNRYVLNPYSRVNRKVIEGEYNADIVYVTTNYRVPIYNEWLDDLKYLCEPTEFHEKRVCVRFICDRGVSHEFVRHRVFSFAQESTRYCNYTKDKFGNEITYICPSWLNYDKVQEIAMIANRDNKEVYKMGHDESLPMEERGICSFIYDMSNHEHGYLFQIAAGWTPQQARAVLPNALKTELVMTGFVEDWIRFFQLRAHGATGKPHPDAQALAEPLLVEFIMREYITEDEYERKNT